MRTFPYLKRKTGKKNRSTHECTSEQLHSAPRPFSSTALLIRIHQSHRHSSQKQAMRTAKSPISNPNARFVIRTANLPTPTPTSSLAIFHQLYIAFANLYDEGVISNTIVLNFGLLARGVTIGVCEDIALADLVCFRSRAVCRQEYLLWAELFGGFLVFFFLSLFAPRMVELQFIDHYYSWTRKIFFFPLYG